MSWGQPSSGTGMFSIKPNNTSLFGNTQTNQSNSSFILDVTSFQNSTDLGKSTFFGGPTTSNVKTENI